ncbi:HAD family hydrolase [Kluyvera sichuanensis]|uniref:HAD family hydrolase n=1 Tax=Kluyvera sichuanensis TaxID=2725494 RepID=UPI0034A3794D
MGNKKIMNYNEELEIIKSKIERYDIITFDIFDTLVLRNVFEPTDIFYIVQREYELKFGKLDFDFHELRKCYEIDARKNRSNQEDIVFDNIYEEFLKYYPEQICDRLKTIELEVEKEFIIKNELMFEVYQHVVNLNKEIYFISDMYLPSDFLSNILNELGFNKYNKLYVSGEHLKTKHYGTLYQLVKEHNSLAVEKWLHIGDNFHSDITQAKLKGIAGYHYKKVNERVKKKKINSIEDSILTALEINQLCTRPDTGYWDRFGYSKAARMFYLLTKWLINNIKGKQTDIYFLARDGCFVKKIYDLYYNHNTSLPQPHYLYTSRRAFQWVEILDSNIDEFLYIITAFNPQFSQKLTCREILNNLNIDTTDKLEIIAKYGISLDTVLCVENDILVNARKFLKEIIDEIKLSLNKEKEMVTLYLDSAGLNDRNKILSIFDIGWRGSIHKSIQLFTKHKIFGYYFGTNQFIHSEIKDNSMGFVFDKGMPSDRNAFILRYLMIFEFLFTAPHGSLQHFKKNELGEVIPVLDPVDANQCYIDSIKAMQDGCMKFIQTVMKYDRFFQSCNPTDAIENIKNMIVDEEFEDLYEFSFLHNSVGFGITDDLKNYVGIVDSDEYLQSPENIIQQSKFNLWPGVLLIKKGCRLFTQKEFNAVMLNGNALLPTYIYNNTHENIEVQFAKKIYHFYKRQGIKLSLFRAIHSFKYLYNLFKEKNKA